MNIDFDYDEPVKMTAKEVEEAVAEIKKNAVGDIPPHIARLKRPMEAGVRAYSYKDDNDEEVFGVEMDGKNILEVKPINAQLGMADVIRLEVESDKNPKEIMQDLVFYAEDYIRTKQGISYKDHYFPFAFYEQRIPSELTEKEKELFEQAGFEQKKGDLWLTYSPIRVYAEKKSEILKFDAEADLSTTKGFAEQIDRRYRYNFYHAITPLERLDKGDIVIFSEEYVFDAVAEKYINSLSCEEQLDLIEAFEKGETETIQNHAKKIISSIDSEYYKDIEAIEPSNEAITSIETIVQGDLVPKRDEILEEKIVAEIKAENAKARESAGRKKATPSAPKQG